MLNNYGLKAGKIVSINDVSSGLSCNCICPSCHSTFIAKKGSRQHHFAHYSSEDCGSSLETALHLLAKQIVENSKYIFTPHTGKLHIKSCLLEAKEGSIIPDITITTNDGKKVFIEIFVTHKVGLKKEAILKELAIPTLEISLDLNDSNKTEIEIKSLILDQIGAKRWIIPFNNDLKNLVEKEPQISHWSIKWWSKYYRDPILQSTLQKEITSEYFQEFNEWPNQAYFDNKLEQVLKKEKQLIDLKKPNKQKSTILNGEAPAYLRTKDGW